MSLQLRPRHRALHNLSLVQFFSSSTTSDSTAPAPPAHSDSPDLDLPPSQPRESSSFSDVNAKLRTQEQSQRMRQQLTGNPSSPPSSLNSLPQHQQQQRPKLPSIDEIRKGLSEFPPRPATEEKRHSYSPRMSFENVINRGSVQSPSSGSDPSTSPTRMTFSTIMKSLKSNTTSYKPVGEDRLSLSRFKEDLKLKPDSATPTRNVFDRKNNLLPSLSGKNEKEGKLKMGVGEATATSGGAMNTDFHKIYSYQELGEKLRNLRRLEKKGKDDGSRFSFLEMNERLGRLRELEEKEIESRIGKQYNMLRSSLLSMGQSDEEKARKKTARSIDILGQLSPTPDSMNPPQEHLVEKYFHPDNMSSAEKLKIELAKVREEFKMSESDCGSARVQVAQLTTKIKHLSSTLHKKDKHSRKGLEGMVQKRKNLLRYLRRTDWDSYCLVLSKLGLRDNPAYKL